MENVFLSLGSNMGDRQRFIRFAIDSLSGTDNKLVKLSPLYETEPWGFQAEQHFLNQVIKIRTKKTVEELLREVKEIEQQAGRIDSAEMAYESRTLDIDILFYGKQIIQFENLVVPHPRLHLRKFVLIPLADVAPEFIHPLMGKKVSTLLQECPDDTGVWSYPGGSE